MFHPPSYFSSQREKLRVCMEKLGDIMCHHLHVASSEQPDSNLIHHRMSYMGTSVFTIRLLQTLLPVEKVRRHVINNGCPDARPYSSMRKFVLQIFHSKAASNKGAETLPCSPLKVWKINDYIFSSPKQQCINTIHMPILAGTAVRAVINTFW